MDKAVLAEKLQTMLSEPVLRDVPLSGYTTWKIGGCADVLITPGSKEEVAAVLPFLQQENVPWMVMGNGSNLLVGDKGVRGVVIRMGEGFAGSLWRGMEVEAGAGMLLGTIALEAAERGAAGLEFARGIPGSLGGAIRMNAGAYGHNLSDFVTGVTVVDYTGAVRLIPREELEFAYRDSSLFRIDAVVTSVALKLEEGQRDEIMEKMKEYQRKRGASQPLEFPSCGSVFRNPANDHAGRLVELSGLRGTQVGHAAVSPKHGNFIINLGGATAADVRELIQMVQDRVYEYAGVHLEPEVKFVGEF